MNPFDHIKNLHTKKSLKNRIKKDKAIRKLKNHQDDE